MTEHPPLAATHGHRPRGLWLARERPFPFDSGDRIYTARLARAVAEAGADLTLTGYAADAAPPPADWPVRFVRVAGAPRSKWRALASPLPLVTAVHATPAYRALLRDLLDERWDFIVLDQYGMGWALDACLHARGAGHRPLLVHVAHDHEASLSAALYRDYSGSSLKRALLWQNHVKTRLAERRLARRVDLLSAITAEDAARFRRDAPGTPSLALTPGYDGVPVAGAAPRATLERRVLLVGSFQWLVKQHNLQQFIAAADPVFARHGIVLDVIGSMPSALAQTLREQVHATRLHGFVDDIAPWLAGARLAVVPEAIGGGFKLKFLDYVFGRVPVATLEDAAAGLPPALRAAMLRRADLPGLVEAIVATIDDGVRLDGMQQRAADAARALFRWSDRGEALLSAVRDGLDQARATEPSVHAPTVMAPHP
ncbi:MAG TPA: glycosyltransferase [Methylibium sp.]|nr:glycosyltransferase [Methylibium sp.]